MPRYTPPPPPNPAITPARPPDTHHSAPLSDTVQPTRAVKLLAALGGVRLLLGHGEGRQDLGATLRPEVGPHALPSGIARGQNGLH